MLAMIRLNSLVEEHSACFHSSENAVVLVRILLLRLRLCSKPEILQQHVIVFEFQDVLQQTSHVSGCASCFQKLFCQDRLETIDWSVISYKEK